MEKRNLSCEPDCRKVADWRLLRELSMDAECFRRTRLGSTDREGHLEEYTLLCDQTNEELNLHRIEDVALSKELMFTYQRERSIVEAEVLHKQQQETITRIGCMTRIGKCSQDDFK